VKSMTDKKEKETLTRITDSHTFKLDKDEAKIVDGVLEVPVIVAREMVYDYGDTKAFKPKEELEKAAQFADGIPITRSHPDAGIVTDQTEILGTFRKPKTVDEELGGVLRITDKSLIGDVLDGTLKETSGGFFCNLDRTASGDYKGQHYDATQTNIVLNHVAVVDQGRCSLEDGCGIQIDEQTATKGEQDSPADLRGKLDTAIGMAETSYETKLADLLKEVKEMLDTENKLDAKEAVKADSELNTKLSETVLTLKADNEKLRADLDAITIKEKEAIVTELSAVQDTKSKTELLKLSVLDLRKELDMVNQITATRLSIDNRPGSTKAIDKAYANVGGKD